MNESNLSRDSRVYEYTSAVVPVMPQVPVLAWKAALHENGPTRIITFDASDTYGVDYVATTPNLLAGFVRICEGENVQTEANATSQAFYVIRGSGTTNGTTRELTIEWKQGDLFVVPAHFARLVHAASTDAALYWVSDQPLLSYLGVAPTKSLFEPTYFSCKRLLDEVENVRHQEGAEHRNRMGILLGNRATEANTKTLTPTLWSLLNTLPPHDAQPPHRHNSVAVDLCVYSPPVGGGVYTLMGPELGEDGWVKDPIRCEWTSGSVFITPPGWWHSHHNETDEYAWVLPLQDAGLHLNSRTLDIQFSRPPAVAK